MRIYSAKKICTKQIQKQITGVYSIKYTKNIPCGIHRIIHISASGLRLSDFHSKTYSFYTVDKKASTTNILNWQTVSANNKNLYTCPRKIYSFRTKIVILQYIIIKVPKDIFAGDYEILFHLSKL